MNQLPLEQKVLVVLQAVALVGLCVRVSWNGLYRTYTWFFAYLVLTLVQAATLSFVPIRSVFYLDFWLVSEGIIICLYAMVVLESYSIVLRELPGIASMARRYLKVALTLAILLSLLLVALEQTPGTLPQYFIICERTIISSLMLFVLASSLFLAYYPIPLNRNTVVYAIGFAIYLLAKASALFVSNLKLHRWDRSVNAVLVGVSTACLWFWLFSLSRRGEAKTLVVGHKWNPADEKNLLSQLQNINDALLRVAKK